MRLCFLTLCVGLWVGAVVDAGKRLVDIKAIAASERSFILALFLRFSDTDGFRHVRRMGRRCCDLHMRHLFA